MSQHLQTTNYSNQRILTTAQIAEAYGVDTQTIYRNFSNNKDRYTEGKHYYCLKGKELKDFLNLHLQNSEVQNQSKIRNLYLWTEKGALIHAKSLNTDHAWQAHEMLVDNYYRQQDIIQQQQHTIEQLDHAIAALQAASTLNNDALGNFELTVIAVNIHKFAHAISDLQELIRAQKKLKTGANISALSQKVENAERYLKRLETRVERDVELDEQLLPLLMEHQQLQIQ